MPASCTTRTTEKGQGPAGEKCVVACDLADLETAQAQYREVLTMQSETLPFGEWMAWRPRYLKPRHYRDFVTGLANAKRHLEAEYGLALLAVAPSVADQRNRPN